ncbi:MAG: dephospho-CoA kinase [Acidimicrobiales bacterium]
MRLVALTGGIGSGKSSVSEQLAARGAVIIDADETVKDLQRPGRPLYDAMVARWGEGILGPDGELDRPSVASLVFGDDVERKAMNRMVRPLVRTAMRAVAGSRAGTDGVVIYDIPLLVEGGGAGPWGASAVIVVDCPTELAIERLMAFRSFTRADAEARIAAQASREDRLAIADLVVDNSGDLAALEAEVERCWDWLETLGPTPWPPPDDGGGEAADRPRG